MNLPVKACSFCLVLIWLLTGCHKPVSPIARNDDKAFAGYWFKGKAEITSFQEHQIVEGTARDGHATLVFVAEDLHKMKGVKLKDPKRHAVDAVKVIRSTLQEEFVTGISSSQWMTTVFTPVEYETYPQSLKLTSGAQDWSGQFYTQANWKGHRYEVHRYSSLEKEGDSTFTLVNTWLEDEILNKIRVAPDALPLGEFEMVPSSFYLQQQHRAMKAYKTEATIKADSNQYAYILNYPGLKRVMEIYFEKTFPYKIQGWKEIQNGQETASAHALTTIMSDYWNYTKTEDQSLRLQLGLPLLR